MSYLVTIISPSNKEIAEGEGDFLSAAERFASAHLRLLTAVVALCGVAATVYAGRVGAFHDDDFLQIGLGQDYGLSARVLLNLPRFEHLAPAANALSWLLSVFGPEWWMAQWFSALCIGAFSVLVVLLGRMIAGSAVVALVAGAVAATSIVGGTITLWWTGAAFQLPMLCFAVATMLLSVRWMEERSTPVFVYAILAQIAACLFYDRAQIVPAIVFVLLVVATPAGEPITGASLWRRTKQAGPLVAALFGVALLQLVITIAIPEQLHKDVFSEITSHSLSQWLVMVVDWWRFGVASVISNQFAVLSVPPGVVTGQTQLLALIALGSLVAGTIRGRRSALVWASAVVLITVSGLQVAALRLGTFGPVLLAWNVRYHELTLLTLVVLVPAAWAAAGRPRPHSRMLSILLVAVIGVGAVGWLMHLNTGIAAQQKASTRAGEYASNFRASVRQWNATGQKGSLLDGRVPLDVAWIGPPTEGYDYLSKVAPVLEPQMTRPPVDGLSGPPLLVDFTGKFVPVRLGKSVNLVPTKPRCGFSNETSAWLELGVVVVSAEVPLAVSRSDRELLLTVRLSKANEKGQVGITSSESTFPVITLELGDHPGGFRTRLPSGTKDLTVQLWNGAAACINSIKVAEIR